MSLIKPMVSGAYLVVGEKLIKKGDGNIMSMANGRKFLEQAVVSYAQNMLPNIPLPSLPVDIQQSLMVAVWFELLQYVMAKNFNMKDFLIFAGAEYLSLKTAPYVAGYFPGA